MKNTWTVVMNGMKKEITEEEMNQIAADVMKKFSEIAAEKGMTNKYEAYLDRTSFNGYDMVDMEGDILTEIIDGMYDEYFADDVIEDGFNYMVVKMIEHEGFAEGLRVYPYSRSHRDPEGTHYYALADDCFTHLTKGCVLDSEGHWLVEEECV